MDKVLEELEAWVKGLGQGEYQTLLEGVVTGKIRSSPFPGRMKEDIKAELDWRLGERGLKVDDFWDHPLKKHPHFSRLGCLLADADDPDAAWLRALPREKGVPIGVGVKMPRVPAVFPPKVKWRLEEVTDPWEPALNDNYQSCEGHEEWMARYADKEVEAGSMVELPHHEAPECTVAALGLVDKPKDEEGLEDHRVVFDATHIVEINNRIRAQDQTQTPGAPDLKRVPRHVDETNEVWGGLAADVESAHRIIPNQQVDWKKQACWIGERLLANTSGTYGVGSAGYWWARLGAGTVRMLHYTLGARFTIWLLLFADDFNLMVMGQRFTFAFMAFLLLLEIFDIPMALKKLKGGNVYPWIGYEVTLSPASLGISGSRAEWIQKFCGDIIRSQMIVPAEFGQGLGRMGFVVAALTYEKAFLAPLYAYAAVWREVRAVPAPLFLLMILRWIAERVALRRSLPCGMQQQDGGVTFRGDAKAEGMKVVVAGWRPIVDANGLVRKDLSPWFAVDLTPESAPWAFKKGLPFRSIMALELFTILLMVMFLEDAAPDGQPKTTRRRRAGLSAFCDSEGGTHVLAKGASSAFPLCLITMELAAQLEARGAVLDAEWAPRTVNTEADALTNGDTTGFEESQRVSVDVSGARFMVLPRLQDEASSYYEELASLRKARKAATQDGNGKGKGKKRKLREAEPW